MLQKTGIKLDTRGSGILPLSPASAAGSRSYKAHCPLASLRGICFKHQICNLGLLDNPLEAFYKNVLGRPEGADAGGLAYWNGKLSSGESTRSSLANDILGSAHTFKGDATWGWVADLLDNKIAVANKIAIEWG